MADFQTVAAELVAGVLNTHPSTATLMKAAMVRQLDLLQPEIVPFMEVSDSFSTAAGTMVYTSATTGFPKSLLRFERLWYDLGSSVRWLTPTDPGTVRALQEQPSQAYPPWVCWFEEKLQFGPAPAGIYVVKWDGILDSRKNTADGALITTASTIQTNGWLSDGLTAFRHLCWGDYYATSPDQRPDLAQAHVGQANVALGRLREAGKTRQEMNGTMVTPSAWDDYSLRQGSGYSRISALFPGAPV